CRDDYDLIGGASKRIIPFEIRRGSPEWLLFEFCSHYSLSEPVRTSPAPEPGPTQKDLFKSAINENFFAQECLDDALAEHFRARADGPSALLPIQLEALDPAKSKFIFKNPESAEKQNLRHVLIYGPTGCGKTTLLQALVLNGLHNR